jgi:hypothetical protein
MYYMDDPARRGGTFLLTVVTGVVRRMVVPCKTKKTRDEGGPVGVQNGEDKEKGPRGLLTGD